jgi:hypothetical protein
MTSETGPVEAEDDGARAVEHGHGPGRGPDAREAHAADRFLEEQSPDDAARVAEHHEEMRKLGAEVKGEGEIE